MHVIPPFSVKERKTDIFRVQTGHAQCTEFALFAAGGGRARHPQGESVSDCITDNIDASSTEQNLHQILPPFMQITMHWRTNQHGNSGTDYLLSTKYTTTMHGHSVYQVLDKGKRGLGACVPCGFAKKFHRVSRSGKERTESVNHRIFPRSIILIV